MSKLTFSGVTQAGVDALEQYLLDSNMVRTEGDSGKASGQGIEMNFELDLKACTLTLDLVQVPDHMPASHIEYAVQTMLSSGKPFGIAGMRAERLGYNWAWG